MNPSISVHDLTKIYPLYQSQTDRLRETLHLTRKKLHEDFYALQQVSFHVYPGETIGIIGKNGAGKSTLLKIITGVLTPTHGSVQVQGKISALLELGAGFNPDFTGLENIYLNGTIMGYTHDEITQRLPAILAFAEIGTFISQPVKTYSSGMFMRLAFSVAINVDPDILIVDEALSVGDILFQAKCFKKIQEFKEKGKSILFVTHSLNNILQYCDRCLVMHKGSVVAEGDPAAMVDRYKQLIAMPEDDAGRPAAAADGPAGTARATGPDVTGSMAAPAAGSGGTGMAEARPDGLLKDHLVLNGQLTEYGSQALQIIDYGIMDANGQISNLIDAAKPFRIMVRIRAITAKTDPIIAFSIKNVHGVEICGTNTLYLGQTVGTMAAGQEIEVTFTQRLPLNGDGYLLSLGCTGYEGDDFVVYHRLYDVAPLQVINERRMVGFFDPLSEVAVHRIQPGK